MDKLQELEERVLTLRSLSQEVSKKIADAKDNDAHIGSQVEYFQLQLTALRQRTLLKTLQRLHCELVSQRQRLNIIIHENRKR